MASVKSIFDFVEVNISMYFPIKTILSIRVVCTLDTFVYYESVCCYMFVIIVSYSVMKGLLVSLVVFFSVGYI